MSSRQNTTRNWGAPESVEGRICQRQGSRSSDTGQYPAIVTLSAEAATEPNSNTVTLSGFRITSTAPFMAGAADVSVLADSDCWGFAFELPVNQEIRPMGSSFLGFNEDETVFSELN
ncbi:hypothetical protein ACOSP7_000067 [Xanthoceras sorbifolium]